jgi:hypothetical protein
LLIQVENSASACRGRERQQNGLCFFGTKNYAEIFLSRERLAVLNGSFVKDPSDLFLRFLSEASGGDSDGIKRSLKILSEEAVLRKK